VLRLVQRVRDGVEKALRRAGKWSDEEDAADAADVVDGEQQLLLALWSGAVAGRAALAKASGRSAEARAPVSVRGPAGDRGVAAGAVSGRPGELRADAAMEGRGCAAIARGDHGATVDRAGVAGDGGAGVRVVRNAA
jgi:hypothetical protein